MMNGFVNDEDNGWLMYNTKYCSADVAYSSIYSQAKKSVYRIDNYIGLRTLVLLKNAPAGADIKIFSDNIGSGNSIMSNTTTFAASIQASTLRCSIPVVSFMTDL